MPWMRTGVTKKLFFYEFLIFSTYIGHFRELAKRHGLWLSLGGFHHKVEIFEKFNFFLFEWGLSILPQFSYFFQKKY